MMHYDANYPDWADPEEKSSSKIEYSDVVLRALLCEFQAAVKDVRRANALSSNKIHLIETALSDLARLAEGIVKEIEELKSK